MEQMSNRKVICKMIKLVFPLTLPMLVAIIMGVLGFICAIMIPVLSVMALLQISGMYPHILLSHLFSLLLLLALLRGVLHYIEQACNHYIAFKLLAIIRDRVYSALRRLAPTKLDGKEKGNLISLITSDIELLEVFYAHTISPVMIAIIMAILLLKIFSHMHYIAMIVAFLSYLIMAVCIPIIVDKLGRRIGMENREKIGSLSSFILETFRGMSTLQQYQMYEKRKESLLKKNKEIENLQKEIKSIESIQKIISYIFISLATIVMFIIMYDLYMINKVSVYDVMMSTILLLSSFSPFLAISSLSNNLLSTLNSGRRVIALIEEEEMIKEVYHQKECLFDDIEINDMSFSYQSEDIFQHLDLSFQKNKITGISGKSGSGKSTILKLIMRFYDPKKGNVTIGKRNLKTINTKDMRRMFAYVTQDTILFHDTIYNNLKLANLNATKQDIIEACQKANIHDFIESLPQGYLTHIAELGSSLSGGERQRLSLARAFLSKSECILLDEPTSHLDILNEAMILKSLKNAQQTIIFVSHRESTMCIVDKLYHIDQGRIS